VNPDDFNPIADPQPRGRGRKPKAPPEIRSPAQRMVERRRPIYSVVVKRPANARTQARTSAAAAHRARGDETRRRVDARARVLIAEGTPTRQLATTIARENEAAGRWGRDPKHVREILKALGHLLA
jgi:hypothetical protein